MSRLLDGSLEEKQARIASQITAAVQFGLERDIQAYGANLKSISFSFGGADCLAVVRAHLGGDEVVSFAGAADLEGCILKLARLAKQDKLVWKDDRYAKK